MLEKCDHVYFMYSFLAQIIGYSILILLQIKLHSTLKLCYAQTVPKGVDHFGTHKIFKNKCYTEVSI